MLPYERMLWEDTEQIITTWFYEHGLQILLITVLTLIAHKTAHIFIERIIRKTVRSKDGISKDAEKKREDTLIGIFHQVVVIALWVMAVMLILTEIGINIAPLIAGAGIIGLAFGFGGQYLIKDLISGFFIILENQYRVNDVVCVGETCGLVENMNIRTTILRDLDGTVHHIPNGEIKIASNLSKQFARVNLDIGVDYASDLDNAIKVIDSVGKELAKDKKWKDDILTPPQVLRVNEFADSQITIKILGDTKPMRQWDVTGELRKRLKTAFDKEGIVIPFPQRVIHKT